MIRLGCTPLNKRVFSLLILGENARDNKRLVHLDTGVFECSSVKIFLVNEFDERFNFVVKENGKGQFTASKDGKYTLEITSDLMLKECSENEPYFIEVVCRGYRQLAKVGLVNAQSA